MGNSSSLQTFGRQLRFYAVLALSLVWGQAAFAHDCSVDTVYLKGSWGNARFTVELADEPEEQALGLMNRASLPLAAGMYFVNRQPRTTSFWMRNTLIPLDMIFMDSTGTVTRIHENAIPLDETAIPGGDGVLMVLEINGGLSSVYGINVGTTLRHPAVPQDGAAWPCDAP